MQTVPPFVWPDHFELESYLSSAVFTPAQTGAAVGFAYKRPLDAGLQDSVAWWRGHLSTPVNHFPL
jgi:nucleoside-diphosphate-sugar epimerase